MRFPLIFAIGVLTIGLSAEEPKAFMVPMADDPEVARILSSVRVVSASTKGSIKHQEPLDVPITGESIDQLLANYLRLHFDGIPRADRTFHAFYPPSNICDAADEVEVRFIVLKPTSGYVESLRLRQREDRWESFQISQLQRLSFDPGDSYPAEDVITGTRIDLNDERHNK